MNGAVFGRIKKDKGIIWGKTEMLATWKVSTQWKTELGKEKPVSVHESFLSISAQNQSGKATEELKIWVSDCAQALCQFIILLVTEGNWVYVHKGTRN